MVQSTKRAARIGATHASRLSGGAVKGTTFPVSASRPALPRQAARDGIASTHISRLPSR
jgi:hypothetical protein